LDEENSEEGADGMGLGEDNNGDNNKEDWMITRERAMHPQRKYAKIASSFYATNYSDSRSIIKILSHARLIAATA